MIVTLSVLAFFIFIWINLYFIAKKKDQTSQIQKPFFEKPFEVIAHRGGSSLAPENTMPAFETSIKISNDIIFELDVQYSKDKKIILFHDDTLDRVTNGSGFVREKNYEELLRLDAGFHFKNENEEYSFRGKGVRIPLLEDVLKKFPNTRMIIEIKTQNSELTKEVYSLINKYNRIETTIIGSKFSRNLTYIRTLHPNLLTAASPDEMMRLLMLENLKIPGLAKVNADFFCLPEKHNNITVLAASLIEEIHKRRKKVFVWTINDETQMKKWISLGVDGIITDRPKELFTLLENKN